MSKYGNKHARSWNFQCLLIPCKVLILNTHIFSDCYLRLAKASISFIAKEAKQCLTAMACEIKPEVLQVLVSYANFFFLKFYYRYLMKTS